MASTTLHRRPLARAAGIAALAAMLIVPTVAARDRTITGPSSSASPYLVPVAPGVVTRSFLTVGDTANNGYALSGIPDGLGIIDEGRQFRVLMNHEIAAGLGTVRSHGGIGAFVSDWKIDARSGEVVRGEDLIRRVYLYDSVTGTYGLATGAAANISRLCSADLPAQSAFWDERSGKGYRGRIFMNGEEVGNEGRAFASIATGTQRGNTYELPYLGKFSWENSVANPATGRMTLVIGLDDTTPGQLYVYTGTKKSSGSPIERAGLAGGTLWGVKSPVALEDRATGVGAAVVPFSLHQFGDVSGWTGAQLQAASVANGVTEFLRPEDGAWDPRHPNDFYFVTTDRFDTVQTPGTPGAENTPAAQVGNSRLWRLHFENRNNPALGGTLEQLLDGTEGPQMMDNLTVDRTGHVLIQEDPGNQGYLARVWSYDVKKDKVTLIAQHDPRRFETGAVQFLTRDEESSGIIDASAVLGAGWFLADVQAHYAIAGQSVEGGQLLAIYSPASDWTK